MRVQSVNRLPGRFLHDRIYRVPSLFDPQYYRERTSRNIGWISEDEQELIRNYSLGIAGCGGMGGMLGERFVRLGVGTVKIADIENFDTTNMNRQYAAVKNSIGKSKALSTGRMLRAITNDFTLEVYPQGICEEVVDQFLEGCSAVCD